MADIPASDDFFYLSHIAFSPAPIATTSGNLMDIERVSRSGNFRKLVPLIVAGAVFTASPWDRMRIITIAGRSALIQIAEGDQRLTQGWVPLAWLRPAPQLLTSEQLPASQQVQEPEVEHELVQVRRAG